MKIIKKTAFIICVATLFVFLSACTDSAYNQRSSQMISSETTTSSMQITAQVKTATLNTESDFIDNSKNLPYYVSYSQEYDIEEPLNANPIDRAYLQDDAIFSTAQIVENYGKYCGFWETEINNALSILRENISEESWNVVTSSQVSWEDSIREDITLFDALNVETMGGGSGVSVLNSKKGLIETRYRALELIECCIITCGEYKFCFNE
jgi:hypothetical protein